MTQTEYEQTKRRLEDSRRAGLELLETAYRSQMQALQRVWELQGGSSETPLLSTAAPTADDPPPPPPPQRQSRRGGEVKGEIQKIFDRLPRSFTRNDICALLGYQPERSALFRVLEDLRQRGAVVMEKHGLGPRATVYRKLG